MRDLLESGTKAPLQQLDVIAGTLTGTQEAGIGHDQRRGEIAGKVAPEQSLRRALGKGGAARKRLDFGTGLDLRQLHGHGKGP